MHFIITLGYPKRDHLNRDDWNKYATAGLQVIDWETGSLAKEERYVSPPGQCAPDGSIQFKAGSCWGSHFLAPTNTEILVYEMPQLELKRVYTHPSFNDLHHVTVNNDVIYICNTGLEIIQLMDFDGNLIGEHNLASIDTWERFNREKDYRLIQTTKPHETHVNHVFFIDDQLWCTRFMQKDAICVEDHSKRIDLAVSDGMPHDGLVHEDFIFFTITDGYVVIVDKRTLDRVEVLNLNEISAYKVLLGWCRGIEVIGNKAYVGFTAFRKSRFREYGLWVKHGKKPLGSRIAEYNLHTRSLVKEVPIAQETGASIFTIKKIPGQTPTN